MASAMAAAAADLAFRLPFLPKGLAVPEDGLGVGWLGASIISCLVTVRATGVCLRMATGKKPSTADKTRASEKRRKKTANLILECRWIVGTQNMRKESRWK